MFLTLKRHTKIAADDILIFYFYLSKKIRLDFFMRIFCLAEDSLETSSLIFCKSKENQYTKLSKDNKSNSVSHDDILGFRQKDWKIWSEMFCLPHHSF